MFCVPLDGPPNVISDNQGVVNITIPPQYNLGKKHCEVNYHDVFKVDAEGILRAGKEYTETNLAYLLANILCCQ